MREKSSAAYLRVVAGFFGYVFLIVSIEALLEPNIGAFILSAAVGVGLWWLALAAPLRERRARKKAEEDALIARAEAGHEAFLQDDPAAFAPPPALVAPPRMRTGVKVAIGVAVVFGLIGTGGVFGEPEEDAPAVAQAQAPAEAPAPASAPAQAPAPARAPAEPVEQDSFSSMPAVVCLDLQAAQDLIQAGGTFYSKSQDATGAGRKQVLDRNWVVTGQTPAAGEPVAEGEAVLSVVKKGEPGDCS